MLALSSRDQSTAHGAFFSLVIFIPTLWSPIASANLSGATIVDYAKGPVIAVESQTPKVMLQMSKDERWWDKIYTDYDD
ncbi:MAG: hypothetical protein AAF384_17040, partial [Pseudomonadota bacterium]